MTSQASVLIIDDEPDLCELLDMTLRRMGVSSRSAATVEQGKTLIDTQAFGLCITDMNLPDGNGLDIVQYIQEQRPQLPVAVLTAHGNMELAIASLKAGAFDFASKPIELDSLRAMINTALKVNEPTPDNTQQPDAQMIGQSAVIEKTRQTIRKLARSQAPVHIRGESGTGKELAARMIHQFGPRADKSFIAVNCGAIPEQLMESEFFGHKKGSFTGATQDRAGFFQAAHGGTLFLDEIADLPLHMQVKLLRAIQEKSVRPVGAQQESSVDVRILSATHKDLSALVEDGTFRQDLYYRINVIELQLPSLRERPDDIGPITDHLLQKIANRWQVTPMALTPDAQTQLKSYTFPGNIRELENILERAITLADGDEISACDLALPEHPSTAALPTGDTAPVDQALEPMLMQIEKETIQKALQQTNGNKTAAAKLLGLSFSAFRYRLGRLGLE